MQRTRTLFGTDGIRGEANQWPMTAEVALQVGRALAYQVRSGKMGRRHPQHKSRIVVGKDTRLSCYMLEQALTAGICSMGLDTLLIGPLPTPGVAFVAQSMRADAGIVVSASHNPYMDNGIKIFGADGFKLPDAAELELEELILGDALRDIRPTGMEIGRAVRIDDARGRYIVYLKSVFPNHLTLDGVRVVVDCANGAAYKVAPEVLRELGAEVITVGVEPNGVNINHECGSLHPEKVQALVKQHQAHLGIALDGDADRVILVDENGKMIDGDAVLALCALELQRRHLLANNTLVTTVMSNLGLDKAMQKAGIQVLRTPVGDRYVVECLRERGCNFGGEQSGHLVFLDHATTGDGMVAALVILATMVRDQKKLSELTAVFQPYPQKVINIKVTQKTPLDDLPHVQDAIRKAEAMLAGEGRTLVRYSGTEMKARVLVEGADAAQTETAAHLIAQALRDAVGA